MLQYPWFPKTRLVNPKSTVRIYSTEEGQEPTAQQSTYNQVLQGELPLLNECKLSQNKLTTELLHPVLTVLSSGESPLVSPLSDLRHKIVNPLHLRQDEDWKAECFSAISPPLSPQPTCDTSLDGLQFASLPAPPYVSRKKGNKEIPCYALQCFPEKKPHPCTWDEAESQSRAFTTQHQQV